jgi:hypothetical protein
MNHQDLGSVSREPVEPFEEDDECSRPFPLLLHASQDESHAATMPPKDLKTLVGEVSEVCQRCSIPESIISLGDRRVDEKLLKGIFVLK